jgi:hypothetical protein
MDSNERNNAFDKSEIGELEARVSLELVSGEDKIFSKLFVAEIACVTAGHPPSVLVRHSTHAPHVARSRHRPSTRAAPSPHIQASVALTDARTTATAGEEA